MRFGLSATLSRVATNIRTFTIGFLKDNLKIFFDFKNTDLEHIGTGSLDFDDDDEQVIRTGITNTNFGKAITLTAWVTFNDVDGNRKGLFGSHYYENNEFSIHQHSGQDFNISITTKSGTVAQFNDITDAVDKWVHVAVVIDQNIGATRNVRCYANGVDQGTTHTQSTGDIQCIKEATIGMQSYTDTQTTGNAWNGKIAKVGFWTRALTQEEVLNIMFKSYSDLQGSEKTHLRNWWDLDDISGTTAPDSHGSNDGTLQGTSSTPTVKTIYGNGCPTKPRGADNSSSALADSIGSGSALFDGTDDKIDCGLIPELQSQSNLTITAWIKATNTGGTEPIFSCIKDDNEGLEFGLNGNRLRAIVENGADFVGTAGTNTYSYSTGTGIGWSHVAMVFDGSGSGDAGKLKIYRDGVEESLTYSGTAPTETDNILALKTAFIGHEGVGTEQFFNGNIAQVGLWNRSLSQEEIQEVGQKQYSELTTSEKTNLVSWWALDEIFLGSNTSTNSASGTRYEVGQIVEDKAGTLSTILVDNYDTLDNWEAGNGNSSLSRNADGNLVITASGGSAKARLKSSFTTLETDTMYLTELAVAGGNDTSIYFRLDDEAFGDVKYGNGYLTPNTDASNTTPECLSYRFKSSSTNTGLYVEIGNIDDTKTAIIKSFKLYKIVSGNYGVLTDA